MCPAAERERGLEAELQAPLVLRLENARILEELRRNRTTSRYLGEALGARSVAVRRQDWQALCAAAARLGLLIEPPHERNDFGRPPGLSEVGLSDPRAAQRRSPR